MRNPRKDIDKYILEALFMVENVDGLSYSKLKSTIEGERYLNYKNEGKRLYDEIFNSSLKRLERRKVLERHFCMFRNNGRICYSLTKTGRLEMEMNLNENLATCYLIIFTQLHNMNYKIAGVSVGDILERRKVIKDKINRTNNSKRGNSRIRDILDSARIDKNSYHWFMIDDKITKKTIDDSFSVLMKRNMIHAVKMHNGELRYTISDDLYELLNCCLSIQEDIMLILEEWWTNNKSPSAEAKKWLEFFYPRSEVQIMIANYGKKRQQFPHKEEHKWEKVKDLKIMTELALNRYQDKIEDMQSKFEKTIEKYYCPLLTNFIQVTTNPFILKDIQEYVKTFDLI